MSQRKLRENRFLAQLNAKAQKQRPKDALFLTNPDAFQSDEWKNNVALNSAVILT